MTESGLGTHNTDTEGDVPRCSHGFDRHHYMVSPLPEYTTWAAFWVTVMGVSATPIRIRFQCRLCKEIFDMTEDPEELKSLL